MVNLDDYRARIAQLESELESMNNGWRKRVEELEAERDALQKDVLELHRDTDEQFKEIEDHAFETATLKKRIAELEAERDALKNELQMLLGNPDAVHQGALAALSAIKQMSGIRAENTALRKALEELASTANSIYRNQQMSTQAVASALLDVIVRYATIPQPTPDSLAPGVRIPEAR